MPSAALNHQEFAKNLLASQAAAPTNAGLMGPYRLGFDEIERVVRLTAPGVLALGFCGGDDRFNIRHIGRSDDDIRAQLRAYIGSETQFKFGYCLSPQAAFEKECELFHDFRPPCTRLHPSRALATDWTCPRCRIFPRL